MALNIDKSKMVFHHVARVAAAATSGPKAESGEREMKVCFRHSKHSIKCDQSAPCDECDAGLKLYSWDQCRRHVDVVRAERRFQSLEVDRAEELLDKLVHIDDNGKQMIRLLERLIVPTDAPSAASAVHPKHAHEEERVWRESTCSALKEISKNSLRAHKQLEQMSEHVAREGRLVNESLGHVRADLHAQTQLITSLTDQSRQLSLTSQLSALNERLLALEGALSSHVTTLKQELARMRSHLEERSAHVLAEVVRELHALNETSRETRDQLPERLMDVFGGILMLSANESLKREEVGGAMSAVTSLLP